MYLSARIIESSPPPGEPQERLLGEVLQGMLTLFQIEIVFLNLSTKSLIFNCEFKITRQKISLVVRQKKILRIVMYSLPKGL